MKPCQGVARGRRWFIRTGCVWVARGPVGNGRARGVALQAGRTRLRRGLLFVCRRARIPPRLTPSLLCYPPSSSLPQVPVPANCWLTHFGNARRQLLVCTLLPPRPGPAWGITTLVYALPACNALVLHRRIKKEHKQRHYCIRERRHFDSTWATCRLLAAPMTPRARP